MFCILGAILFRRPQCPNLAASWLVSGLILQSYWAHNPNLWKKKFLLPAENFYFYNFFANLNEWMNEWMSFQLWSHKPCVKWVPGFLRCYQGLTGREPFHTPINGKASPSIKKVPLSAKMYQDLTPLSRHHALTELPTHFTVLIWIYMH